MLDRAREDPDDDLADDLAAQPPQRPALFSCTEDDLAAQRPATPRVDPPELALDEHLYPWRFVKPYLCQGFLEIQIAAQAA